MLTAETQEKYLKILRKGNTLKVDPSDAIELVEKFEDLENYMVKKAKKESLELVQDLESK